MHYIRSLFPKLKVICNLNKKNLYYFNYTYCYQGIVIYLFLDAILKTCVLQERANKLYFANKQVIANFV